MSKTVTEADVRRAHEAGAPLQVRPDQIITPAARDLAGELNVSIETRSPTAAKSTRTIALGSDHGGYALKEDLKELIESHGCNALDLGCDSTDSVDYPVFAARVADAVASGQADLGIMVDGAGIGSAMVANKIPGVRAALCYDISTARNAREHNNANLLTLGGGLIGPALARSIVEAFVETPFGGGRHARRVAMIDALDRSRPH